jgi:gamma-butyrobetaine dioxygenase
MNTALADVLASVECSNDTIIVTWSDSHRSVFPLRWLRYECSCRECGDSQTGIRFVTPADVGKSLAVERCGISATGDLELFWSRGNHYSSYERTWLREHCLSESSRDARLHRPTVWGAELASRVPRVSFVDFMNDDSQRCDAFEAIRDFGLVHVVDGPADVGVAEQLAKQVGPLEETNFGRVFDLQSTADALSIGATRHAASLHTDECYRNMPTGIKFIHCISDSDSGTGYSLFADGFHIGELLHQAAPAAFELLSVEPVTFHRRYEEAIIVARAPIFSRAPNGHVVGFRFQDRSLAPLDVPCGDVDALLDAIDDLMRLIGDAQSQLRLRLAPGESVLFDNHRLLHGRTGFTGHRHLQLCSVNRDTFISEMRVLQKNLNREGPYLRLASGASCAVNE